MTAFFQGFIDLAVTILNAIASILPNSPFVFLSSGIYADFLSKINYFIPIYEMVSLAQAWLIAIGIFYGYQVILRWLKAIE